MRLNYKKNDLITVGGNELENIESFTYLGAVLGNQSSTEAGIKRRLVFARSPLAPLQPQISTALNLSCAFSTPMYWPSYCMGQRCGLTAADMNKLDASHRKCMRRYRVFSGQSNQPLQADQHAATVSEDKDMERERDRTCPTERWK